MSEMTASSGKKKLLKENTSIESIFKTFKDEVDDLKIFDHFLFFSFYVNDPTGTRIEITCTNYEDCKKELKNRELQTHLMKG